jgi:hypothetical protein
MNMKNKEQLLYFFLQGKISLSQYDYKFMANLQTMIQNQNRVTSNQADLFDKLISKYKKQLTKNGLIKEELKELSWKTMVVESTPEYTGASVRVNDDEIFIKVPFNKSFISQFRAVENNNFTWDSTEKLYRAKFNTLSLKVAYNILPEYFEHVRYCDYLQPILTELQQYQNLIWNPTAKKFNDRLLIGACNSVLGSMIADTDLAINSSNLFKLVRMGISIDPEVYGGNEKLKFAAKSVYEVELSDVENIIGWMKNIGCTNVVIGRGLRNTINQEQLSTMVEKYGMRSVGPVSFGSLPDGVSILLQHTSNVDSRTPFTGQISKTVVLKDSRPIEVK